MLRPQILLILSLATYACGESKTPLPIEDAGSSDAAAALDGGPDITRDGGPPADSAVALPDASIDTNPPLAFSCDVLEQGACEEAVSQWYWNGSDCSPRHDCALTGYASLGECRSAYSECGAPDLCSGPLSFADACVQDPGFLWDGEACIAGCDYFATDTTIYSTLEECTYFHSGCGVENTCGNVLPVGCTEIRPTFEVFSNENREACDGFGGYAAQVLFVAPDDGTYAVRVQTDEGVGGRQVGAFVAATRGVCSTRPQDRSAITGCLEYDQPMQLPPRTMGVGAESDRAYTLRIGPKTHPDTFSSLVVCIDRIE